MAEKLTERAELTSLFWNPKPGRVIGIPGLHLDEAQVTDPFTLSSPGEINSRKSQSENFQFSLPIPPQPFVGTMKVVSWVMKVLLAEVTYPKPEITSLTITRAIITQKNPLLVPYVSMKMGSY